MSAPATVHASGPLHWSLLPHPPGEKAEPLARAWVAERLDRCVADIVFERDARGRPQLTGADLDCNWSHSGAWLLVALARGVRVGVDVEALRPRPRVMALAERYFTATEAAWLQAQDPSTRETDFVRLWCAKEAVLKAHGHGLSFGLQRLEFAETSGAITLGACDAALGAPGDWSVSVFAPMAGLVAAIAWRAPWDAAVPAGG